MQMPQDYVERVYAGVLGKIIGVYLGRPFESWTYERIMAELGEINYYVHERRNKRLIVTDDDITGTFTFLRAMEDYGCSDRLTPEQIGQTWLNYIIENRTILWWGGIGKSTEHTAYLRLKDGVKAPLSGAVEKNGKVIAEQIGAQIFIDGWAMIVPGEPDKAADFARRAASVSHDGEAIYAAQVIAAMESQAFVEPNLDALLDCGLSFIPQDSTIYRLISDIREWRVEFADWKTAREHIASNYGYDKYPGNCHIVPNHALIMLALLYGDDDFQKSLMIVNTSGWDTDCNSGNVGCLLGIKNGLSAFEGLPDWRGPVADRLYLPTADGGRSITDAVTEAIAVANIGYTLHGKSNYIPKDGARFHFELPGSMQGFEPEDASDSVRNIDGFSTAGSRSLAFTVSGRTDRGSACISTPTFVPPGDLDMRGYELIACPLLYSGQTIRGRVIADSHNPGHAHVQIFIDVYQVDGSLRRSHGPEARLEPGAVANLRWAVGNTDGFPIARIGLQVSRAETEQTIYLDWLTWDGMPDVSFTCPTEVSRWASVRPPWIRAWVDAVDHFGATKSLEFEIIQNNGRGIVSQGVRDWTNYSVESTVHVHLARSFGLALRVQGLQRYYALLVSNDNTAKLVKVLDGEHIMGSVEYRFNSERAYAMRVAVTGNKIQASIDDKVIFDVEDNDWPLMGGSAAVICEEGRLSTPLITVRPVQA